jgi:hypothetical protein
VRVNFSPALNQDARFHATLRELLSKDLYVGISALNTRPNTAHPHGRHALLLIGHDRERNYLIKNSWRETAPFSAPLTDIVPPNDMYTFTTEHLDFLIPCTNRVFREVFSTLRETASPTEGEVSASPALSERYGFYETTAEEFITTMTAYFPKYDEFSVTLKGNDYQISQYGRRYSVKQGFGNRFYIEDAFDELDREPQRELVEPEKTSLALEPERGGKRTRKYRRNRTLRKRFRKKYTTKLV